MNIKFTNRARKDLRRLPPEAKEQVREAILSLARNPLDSAICVRVLEKVK